MNLARLFEKQAELDNRIVEEKGLRGQNLLEKKILALQVEMGELANEWRGFKFWSEDQGPRTEHICELCGGRKEISSLAESEPLGETNEAYDVFEVDVECPLCEGYDSDKNPLLEEYVDCLHFMLSIGLDLGMKDVAVGKHMTETVVDQFIELNYQIYLVLQRSEVAVERGHHQWLLFLDLFMGLGEMIGFTTEQIEEAYFDKNKVNHERQDSGY